MANHPSAPWWITRSMMLTVPMACPDSDGYERGSRPAMKGPPMQASPAIPRPEHPRPQFMRHDWLNLNGEWQFEIDQGDSGLERGLKDRELAARITLPFCPDASFSGVGHTDFLNPVW